VLPAGQKTAAVTEGFDYHGFPFSYIPPFGFKRPAARFPAKKSTINEPLILLIFVFVRGWKLLCFYNNMYVHVYHQKNATKYKF
jgi:hypothetical protein